MKPFLPFSQALVKWPPETEKQFFTHKYPKYLKIRIFENTLASDLVFVDNQWPIIQRASPACSAWSIRPMRNSEGSERIN